MDGLKIIVFAVIGTSVALALLGYFAWYYTNEYINNERYVKDILDQLTIISGFPDVLESKKDEIENVLKLVDVLSRPKTTEFISKLNTGLTDTLNVQNYLTTALGAVKTGINNEITEITDNLNSEIKSEIRASLARIVSNIRGIFPW
jgi:hypothetical protein